MAALCNRAGHYIFALSFLSSFFFFFLLFFLAESQRPQIGCLPYFHTWCGPSANLECIMQVWNVLHAARWKYRTQKNRHFGTIAQFCRAVSSQLRHVSTIGKNLLNNDTSSTCSHNMVNFGLLTTEIRWRVWGTPANFNGLRVLTALLHCTLYWASAKLCGVEQRAPPIFGRAAITLGIGPHF